VMKEYGLKLEDVLTKYRLFWGYLEVAR